jgi:hypothetical protein
MVMPPGHHREITAKRPFSRLEKWTLTSLVAGLAVFAVVFLIALTGSGATTARGCVDVSISGATGGTSIHQCGNDAKALCADAERPNGYSGETAREIQAACRKDGIPVG